MRTSRAFAVWLVAAAAALAGRPVAGQLEGPPELASAETRRFVHHHPITVFDPDSGQPVEHQVEDLLRLRPLDGEIVFALDVVGPNAHLCHLEGRAARSPGGWVFTEALEEIFAEERPCVLTIAVESGRAVVEDRGNRCRKVYCGVRARIGRLELEETSDLVAIARELMAEAGLSALITLDDSGAPRSRAMDPFAPGPDLVVWLGTNPASRKVEQIRRDPRVALYYLAPESGAYVTLYGRAELVDDPVEKARRWKDGWERFYPDRDRGYLLIRVVPERLELISERHGILGDPATWRPPGVDLGAGGAAVDESPGPPDRTP